MSTRKLMEDLQIFKFLMHARGHALWMPACMSAEVCFGLRRQDAHHEGGEISLISLEVFSRYISFEPVGSPCVVVAASVVVVVDVFDEAADMVVVVLVEAAVAVVDDTGK